jgi:sec-independent protein translocase protein TatA
MGELSPLHIAIVVVIGLLVFGPKKLPELGRGIGSGLRDFRKGLSGEADPPAPAPVVEAISTPIVETATTASTQVPVDAPVTAPVDASAATPAAAPSAE